MLAEVNPDGAQRLEIQFLHILRRRLQDYLELQVLEQPVGILAVTPVSRTSRGLHICNFVRIRPEHAQEGLRRHGTRADFDVIRLLNDRPTLGIECLELEDQFLEGRRIGF